MRLYSLNGTTKIAHVEHGEIEAEEDGGFEVPHEFGEQLKNTHFDGKKVWEDTGERSIRLATEEEARRRDPATLLAAVERLGREQASDAEAAEAEAKAKAEAEAAEAEAKAKAEAEAEAKKGKK